MDYEKVLKIADEFNEWIDTLPDEKITTWNMIKGLSDIGSQYKGIDCLIHFNFYNGRIVQALCIVTDWKPGALALQSDEGELPKLRAIYPDEHVEFMDAVAPLFQTEYPQFPEEEE